jgi:hypothetical protein
VLRHPDRHPLATSGRVPKVWLHDGVLDMSPPDNLGIHPWHHICPLCSRMMMQNTKAQTGLYEYGLQCFALNHHRHHHH